MTIRKIFAVFALVMLCTCPVFAAEYTVKTTDELISTVSTAQAGDTITIADGRYRLSNRLYIDKAITLKSTAGAIIDGDNKTRVLDIAGDVVLDGLTITGGNVTGDDDGGGILISAGSVTITNCIITDNKTTGFGGGICIDGKNTSANITNCTITNNKARNGGGLDCHKSQVHVTNCRISGNSADVFGGGFYSYESAYSYFTNCTISDNQAAENGGGGCGGMFGAEWLTNCTITGNKANKKGGGLVDHLTVMTITNCTIAGNSAPEGSDFFSMIKSSFRNTIIHDGIVSLIPAKNMDVANCALPPENVLWANSVAIDWENPVPSTVEIDGVTHTVFTAEDNHVLLQVASKGTPEGAPTTDQLGKSRAEHPAIGAVEFAAAYNISTAAGLVNTINSADTGSIITLSDGTYTLSSTLTINKAITIKGSGNTVLQGSGSSRVIDIHADAKLYDLTISGGRDNESNNGGGAIRVSSGHPTIKNCTITGNYANDGGGIAILNNSSAEIIGCTITGNEASSSGGGIAILRGTANITNCAITSNKGYDSGGFYVSNGSAEIMNCTITGNKGRSGGGVLLRRSGTANITNCTITGNEAGTGGGVHSSGSTATLMNCTIIGNEADSGKCVYAYDKGTANFINSIIWDPDATKAAYSGASSSLNFTNCALPANFTGGSGTVNNTSAVTLAAWANPVSSSVRIGGVAHTVFAPSVNPELSLLKGAGTSANAPKKDQLGNDRASTPTIGAVESETSVSPSSIEVSLTGNYDLTMSAGETKSLTLTPEVTAVYSDGRREELLPADYSLTWSVQDDVLSLYAMSFSNGTLTVSSGTAAGSYKVTVRADVQASSLTAATSRRISVYVNPSPVSGDQEDGRGSSGEYAEYTGKVVSVVESPGITITIEDPEGSSGKTIADYISDRDPEELARVTSLHISSGIETISGLNALTNLNTLIAIDCKALKEVDVSDCTKLEVLYVPSCDINTLNIDGCTSLGVLICSNNHIDNLNLDNCTALQGLECSGQTVSGRQMVVVGGVYSVYLGGADRKKIHDVTAYDSAGSEIQAEYDAELGAVVCTQAPARIKYSVATGFSDVDMDVTVYTASESGAESSGTSGSSGCNSGFGMLAVLAAIWLMRRK